MKFTQLSNLQTADLCRQLGLLLHAGVSLGDGLSLLRDGEENGPLKGLYAAMQEKLDGGAPLLQLAAGESVSHDAFGKGMVLSIRPMGNDALIEVAFDKVGTKKLMLRAAGSHLQKL